MPVGMGRVKVPPLLTDKQKANWKDNRASQLAFRFYDDMRIVASSVNRTNIPKPADLTLDDYQYYARKTAQYPSAEHPEPGWMVGLTYVVLGLAGEAGELANTIKKIIRDDNGEMTPQRKEMLTKELGDVLWYVSQVAQELNAELGSIAHDNLLKLKDRHERGVIAGSGDNR
jgi:NTP pyrophosphatase (non-canonical NTP hydrolase)